MKSSAEKAFYLPWFLLIKIDKLIISIGEPNHSQKIILE